MRGLTAPKFSSLKTENEHIYTSNIVSLLRTMRPAFKYTTASHQYLLVQLHSQSSTQCQYLHVQGGGTKGAGLGHHVTNMETDTALRCSG